MTFDEKRTAAIDLLKSKRVRRAAYAPTIVATLWKLGFEVPPPHFVGTVEIVGFATIVIGFVWGALVWLVVWSHNGVSPVDAVTYSAVFGFAVGICAAAYYRISARKLGLPKWKDFNPPESSGFMSNRITSDNSDHIRSVL